MKTVQEMTPSELKTVLFDIDQEIKYKSDQYRQLIELLKQKMQEPKEEKEKDVKHK